MLVDVFKEARLNERKENSKEIIINMLKEKMAISLISKVTGFSEKEIKEIQKGITKKD